MVVAGMMVVVVVMVEVMVGGGWSVTNIMCYYSLSDTLISSL